jgi:hypothetical protein
MTLQQFIEQHRQELSEAINERLAEPYGSKNGPLLPINDAERRMWILNDEGLYLWAKSEGVTGI